MRTNASSPRGQCRTKRESRPLGSGSGITHARRPRSWARGSDWTSSSDPVMPARKRIAPNSIFPSESLTEGLDSFTRQSSVIASSESGPWWESQSNALGEVGVSDCVANPARSQDPSFLSRTRATFCTWSFEKTGISNQSERRLRTPKTAETFLRLASDWPSLSCHSSLAISTDGENQSDHPTLNPSTTSWRPGTETFSATHSALACGSVRTAAILGQTKNLKTRLRLSRSVAPSRTSTTSARRQ